MESGSSFSPPPYQLLFFMFIVLFLLFIPWYMAYESTLEDSMDELKLVLMILPLFLLLAVCWLSSGKPMASGLLPRVEPDAIHRAGSSPWGVGLVVLLLLLMISYQSVFHDQWFPLWSRD